MGDKTNSKSKTSFLVKDCKSKGANNPCSFFRCNQDTVDIRTCEPITLDAFNQAQKTHDVKNSLFKNKLEKNKFNGKKSRAFSEYELHLMAIGQVSTISS